MPCPIDPVIQEQPSGCGIAACAALAGVSYAESRRLANGLGIYAEDQALWSDTEYVTRLLRAQGLEAQAPAPFSDWERLPDRALLAIRWHLENGRPFWHWVVFARDAGQARVLDSKRALKHNVRTDFWRMQPKWFMAVSALPIDRQTAR